MNIACDIAPVTAQILLCAGSPDDKMVCVTPRRIIHDRLSRECTLQGNRKFGDKQPDVKYKLHSSIRLRTPFLHRYRNGYNLNMYGQNIGYPVTALGSLMSSNSLRYPKETVVYS